MFELRKLKLQYDVFNMSRDVQKAVREYLDYKNVTNPHDEAHPNKWLQNVLACSLDDRINVFWVPT